MARSIDPQPKAARGFIPARTDEERYLMRHIEDLAHTAFSRDIARYSAFLSDREQDLARAALGRAGVQEGFRFEGGWLNAERRVLCIEPEYSCGARRWEISFCRRISWAQLMCLHWNRQHS